MDDPLGFFPPFPGFVRRYHLPFNHGFLLGTGAQPKIFAPKNSDHVPHRFLVKPVFRIHLG